MTPKENNFRKQSDKLLSGKVFIDNVVLGYEYNVQLTYDDNEGYENIVYLPTVKVSRNYNSIFN